MLLVAFTIISICLLVFFITNNGLIHQRQAIRLAWAKMDDLLKARYLLVAELSRIDPTPEKLSAVIAARNSTAVALDHQQLARAESALTLALKEIMISGDHDPSLNQNPNWLSLSRTIAENQRQIEQACLKYNHRVHILNSLITAFPHHITAALVGLGLQPMFDLQD